MGYFYDRGYGLEYGEDRIPPRGAQMVELRDGMWQPIRRSSAGRVQVPPSQQRPGYLSNRPYGSGAALPGEVWSSAGVTSGPNRRQIVGPGAIVIGPGQAQINSNYSSPLMPGQIRPKPPGFGG